MKKLKTTKKLHKKKPSNKNNKKKIKESLKRVKVIVISNKIKMMEIQKMDSVVKKIVIVNYIMAFQNPSISDLYYFIPFVITY